MDDVYDLAGRSGSELTGQISLDGTEQAVPSTTDVTVQSASFDLDAMDPPILAGQQRTLANVKTAAYNGEFPDEHIPMPDRVYWWAMRDMYQRFKAGRITKDQGEEEQNRAIQQYRQDMTQYNSMLRVVHQTATFWKEIEATASEYAKSPNRTAEADKFYNAVYGAMPKGK